MHTCLEMVHYSRFFQNTNKNLGVCRIKEKKTINKETKFIKMHITHFYQLTHTTSVCSSHPPSLGNHGHSAKEERKNKKSMEKKKRKGKDKTFHSLSFVLTDVTFFFFFFGAGLRINKCVLLFLFTNSLP